MTEALAVLEKSEGDSPSSLMRRATDVAGVCREIVMRTAMELQGRKYVKVEGWMSIASTYGCTCSIREVVEEERGIRAIAELRRADGTILATAEGYVGLDEPRWANQPMYARRGMAQTRAISRVCRSVFAFVVVLIDSNLQTTPAEEIPLNGEVVDAPTVRAAARVATSTVPPANASNVIRDKSTQVKFGKSKGKHLCDIDDSDLQWQLAAARKSVEANDPKWHDGNLKWFSAVQAEVARRAFGSEATGRIQAQPTQSERVAREETEEEIVTPTMRLAQLARKHGLSMAQMASRLKGVTGRDVGHTHADLDALEASLGSLK